MTALATVVIPTYNRSRQLDRVLASLEHQDTLGDFDVVVVDDGSQDNTPAVAAKPRPYPLTSLHQENAGPGPARNVAIEGATSRLIIFIDDDVIPAPDLIRQHLDAQQQREGVIAGRLVSPSARQPAWAEWECRTLEHQYRDMQAGVFVPTPRQFYTANASVPREALLKAGLFDARFRRAEDVELAYRLEDLGLPFTFEPRAIVEHDTPRTFDAWRSIARQYGRYDILMWRSGRGHILQNIAEELNFARNPATRAVARAAVGRRRLMQLVEGGGGGLIRVLSRVGPRRLALLLCGAYFNTLYLDAACLELSGGRASFWAHLARELEDAERAAPAAVRS